MSLARLEDLERLAARPGFLVAFNGALAAAWLAWGVDLANILISIVTAELVLLGLGAQRRAQLAVQAKLDELVLATSGARDDVAHVEEMTEEAIEAIRR